MEKTVKICNVLGDVFEVPSWQMLKTEMEKHAAKHFGTKVICDPGLLYDARLSAVWRCRAYGNGLPVVGYFCFQVGFRRFPDDFDYGVSAFAPFSQVTADFGSAKICFAEGVLQYRF